MKHLVIIGMVLPEPNSTAAGKRMLQLIDFFLKEKYRISFLSAATNFAFSENLNSIGVEYISIALNDSNFAEKLQELNPDIVLFDRFVTEEQFGWKVAEICPQAIRILDTEDLHFLRKAREKAFKSNLDWDEALLLNDIFNREIASIYRCDLSLIISEIEMELLMNKFQIPPSLVLYVPLFAEPQLAEENYENRSDFVSIGNFLHEPNWHTVLELKRLWPKIKKHLPKAKLKIYGAYVTEKAKQLHDEKSGFLVLGRANSVDEVFRNAKVLLAPIPFGAGIKGKLLDAMALGLPSVTTKIGAEAMADNQTWNGFVTNSDDEFVEKAILLYQDKILWQKARKNGVEIIQKRFLKENFYPSISNTLQYISNHLATHRKNNFLGQVFMHHTLQSTKYLGKWIEEKNKKSE
jgi:glycosyltransferase involved in cell wall biosynthesis